MEKEYAIGIDLGGTSVKYALIDNEGVFYFQGKLPSKADVSAEAVIGQLVTAINEVKAFAQEQGYKINGIGIGTPGIVDSTNRIVLGGAELSLIHICTVTNGSLQWVKLTVYPVMKNMLKNGHTSISTGLKRIHW